MSFTFTKLSFQVQAKPLLACVRRSDGIGNRIGAPTPTTPARDRVIEFGKHKGKMLGTLPSTYLKWVSKNLRAREFEAWAILADQVLEDPVYQDRIQWEFAHNILSGKGNGNNTRTQTTGDDVVSDFREISERFGWDWEDNTQTSGWRNVNFELLGTSKGGRIPRINATATATETSESKMKEKQTVSTEGEGEGGGRRRERRNRLRMKREKTSSPKSKSKGVAVEKSEMKPTPAPNTQTDNPRIRIRNPFPGRQSLLNRATK